MVRRDVLLGRSRRVKEEIARMMKEAIK